MKRREKLALFLATVPWVVLAFQVPSKAFVESPHPISFQAEVQPILKAKCFGCHSTKVQQGGLDLSTPAGWSKGGNSGKVFVPGNPLESLVIKRVESNKLGPVMPMGFPALLKGQIDLLKMWIRQGASFKEPVSFADEIQPTLKARCFSCHSGPTARAGLDLTTAKGLNSVLVPGDPEKSIILSRIMGLGGKSQMPLGFSALPAKDIELFKNWIWQGASVIKAKSGGAKAGHWAYQPISKSAVPKSTHPWVQNPIDAFVLAKLKQTGLTPSARASRETLLRRITLDLTGLPPTLEELDRFLAGTETYSAAVDRLLSSQHYGERMAQSWLDLARYADTNGYEKDGTRTAWPYRDWVIQAFNKNMPYDQFTIEQLAGDLLPKPSQDQLIATGFNRNTMLNLEGGVDQEEAMYEVRNDRVSTTYTVWTGQTIACARCHDHKYDPLSQRDYFKSYAFFANNVIEPRGDVSISEQKYFEPTIPVMTEQQSAKTSLLMKELVIHSAEISAGTALLTSEQDEWLKKAKSDPFERTKVSVSDPGFTVNGNEVFAVGAGPDTATYHLSLTVPEGTRAIKIDALPDPARPNQGPGRASSGNFILTEVSIKEAKVSYAKTDFTQPGYGAEFLQDGNSETGWAIAGGYGKPHSLVLELDHPVSGTLQLDLEFGSKQWVNHTLGHFSVSSTSVEGASRFLIPDDIRAIVNKTERSAAEESKVSDWYKTVSLRFRESNAKIAKVERELRQIRESLPTAMVMREGLGKTEAPIRHRGEFLSPEEVVASGTPAALGPVAGGNRLALAKWMVSPKNPLTARVQVNRIWEMLFGRGIVETSENFGTQGAKPSHPELLDWLAGTYIESGWDTKKLIRLIVRSNTYQQSSATNPKLTKIDPYNVLLARGPRFRLPAESIRDVALASSGLLNKKIGGPPVFPFQPDGVWDSPYSGERWMQSKGADLYRRSIYTFWKRTAPYPSFIAFDAPSREQCTVRRIRTNSPLQALATLNDPGLFDVAKAMGERFKQRPGGLSAQVSAEFRSVLSRNPTPTELNRLTGLFTKVESKNGEGAAWTMLGNVILNLDEALTKE